MAIFDKSNPTDPADKRAKKSVTRKVLGSIIDVRVDRWISLDFLKSHTSQVYGIAKSLFQRQKNSNPLLLNQSEDFETAQRRLGLSDEDLTRRQREFFRLSCIYASFGIALLFYALYMAFQIAIGAMILSICLACYAFSHAFSFHFWYFQVKQRKLGCTFQDWLDG
ncbi:MAG: type IVB secretion system protein IcmV [Pseudomonadota bacterium]